MIQAHEVIADPLSDPIGRHIAKIRSIPHWTAAKQQLVAEFAARGFALLASARVAARIPDFAARHRELAATLTAGDRAWLGLYGELVFRRDL